MNWTLTQPNQQQDLDQDTNSTRRTLKLKYAKAMARKVLGQEKRVWHQTMGRMRNTQNQGIKVNLTVYLSSDYHLMETGIPIFRQVMVTIVVAENDTPIRLQIERSNPAILAPQLLWLSTKSRTRLTSPRRLIPACATKNTSKNKKEHNQISNE